ncbi:MAG: UDP-N-acetylglucosamine pyrophosphorylase [Proteobacteria bacterium]|nr:UDP-N-acetylglucosamine pyrophosphorylase [Pseudomonadota bacterium]
MELKARSYNKIVQLVNKGVDIPNPATLDIGKEVNPERISGNGVTIYPGCRIYGEKTVISAGAKIGYEGPVTIDDCQIGPNVELKGGYFNKAVFLEKANMGLGAHVREGCILEEEAGGAHCVGLKQTILFPFVTLGSLINFCDCLMAGGTSRKDHSEVGSSYIHFNFTPDGDKTTASLIGDVPRGVMLNQPPIFLGGQGGMVGPLRIGYGNIIAAGTVLRKDITKENKLIFGKNMSGAMIDNNPKNYPSISRVVGNNILYLANLVALEQWYMHIRQPFFKEQEFGELIYAGAMDKLPSAKKERIKRLADMADKAKVSIEKYPDKKQSETGKKEFHAAVDNIREIFTGNLASNLHGELRDSFLAATNLQKQNDDKNYIDFIKSLPVDASRAGVKWLEAIIDSLCSEASSSMPSLNLFNK